MLLLARCCWNRISTFFVFIVIRYLSVGAAAGDLTRLWGFGNPLRSSLPPRRLESRSRDRLRRKPRDRDTGDIRPDRDCFIQKYFFFEKSEKWSEEQLNLKHDFKTQWQSTFEDPRDIDDKEDFQMDDSSVHDDWRLPRWLKNLIPKKNWLVMIWGLMVAKTMTKTCRRE